jgi:hypothetical protein
MAVILGMRLLPAHSCELELLLADIRLAGPNVLVPESEVCFQNAVWAISLGRRLRAGY